MYIMCHIKIFEFVVYVSRILISRHCLKLRFSFLKCAEKNQAGPQLFSL